MNRYTLYCTESQTRKALELGAPIESYPLVISPYGVPKFESQGIAYILPTTDQMINWVEEQEGIRCIEVTGSFGWHYRVKKKHDDVENWIQGTCQTRKEATLAAIGAALEYLTKQTKHRK